MNVAIFSPYATVVPHFETELDIAQQHLDAGDQVQFINCTGELANCDFNPNHEPERCQQCLGRRNMGLELLTTSTVPQPEHSQFNALQKIPAEHLETLRTKFESVQQLIDYRIEQFDIGYAVLSSVVSICRDPEPDLDQHQDLVKRFATSAWQAYWQTLDFLAQQHAQDQSIDRVYVCNGRFSAMRGVLRACQKMQVDCYLHERGCDGKHYELHKNHLPHDLVMIEKAIRDSWKEAASNPEREQIACNWFHDRVNRIEKTWHSFVKDQQQGKLPSEFDSDRKNISIFTSSDDEFVAIGKAWQNDLYPNQVIAIASIAHDLYQRQPETQLYLRVHPNLKDVKNKRLSDMLSLDYPNLTVIHPGAAIDSYSLMRASDTVVSFGSSIGCEAVFWGMPSVLLGPSFYQNLGGVYRSHSHEQTIDLLCQTLEPQDKTGALMYAHWLQTRGLKHKYFQSTGLFEGTFKQQTLYARPKPPGKLKRLRRKARKFMAAVWKH